jgi:hypothetical protein
MQVQQHEDLDALALQQLASKRAYLARLHAENAALRTELSALHTAAAQQARGVSGSGSGSGSAARLLHLLSRATGLSLLSQALLPPPSPAPASPSALPPQPQPPPRRLNFLALLLHLLGLALLFVPLGGGGALGGSSARVAATAAAVPVDLVLLVPTTSGNRALHEAVRAQFHRGAPGGSSAAGTAALVLVHGGSSSGGSSSGGSSSSGSGSVVEEALGAPECGEGPLALPPFEDRPGHSWRYHTYSHFTCKLMEGLCAATTAYAPRFVAVASEEALFRWQEFLRARAPALPPRGLVFTRYIEAELHRDGLPPSFWNKGWPILPTFNNSVVLSSDVAATLCTLHRGGKLLLYGPPELFLGGILSTLEGLSWVREESLALGEAQRCSAGVTVTGFKGPQDWAQCALD